MERRSNSGMTTRDTAGISFWIPQRLPSGLRVACVLHLYHVVRCPCGKETAAHPAKGLVSAVDGRKRDLRLTEASLVGPALATFIAALSVRYRLSRAKIAELLATWLDVRLSVGSIDRCIREVGLACEPIVEGLIEDLRQCGILNVDETPWPQRGRLRWLWVALSSTTAVFKIASRRAEESAISSAKPSWAGWCLTVIPSTAATSAASAASRI